MKAADIADQAFLGVVREYNTGRHPPGEFDYDPPQPRWAYTWEVAERLGFPERVVLAKARKLIKRGLMDGCTCGCRGDYNVPGTPMWMPPPDPIDEAIRAVTVTVTVKPDADYSDPMTSRGESGAPGGTRTHDL